MIKGDVLKGVMHISLFALMFFSTALPLTFPNRVELMMSGLYFPYAIIVQFLVVMPVYFLLFRKRDAFSAGRFTLIQFMLYLSLIIFVQYIVSNVIFPSEDEVSNERIFNPPIFTIILTQLAYGLLAPIYEEIAIRGGLFGGLNIIFKNKIFTVLVTSVIFSILHTQYSEFKSLIILFMVSLILTMAKLVSGGLLLPMMLHIFMNLLAIN